MTQLGVYDDNGDGTQQSHDVGILTTGGVLLVQGTVPVGAGAALVDDFRYIPVAPTALLAGNS